MLWSAIIMALREMRKNVMRSLLTMLGVVIGVGSVIALVTVGDGATASVTASISALGENLLIVMPGSDRRPGSPGSPGDPLEVGDADAIRREIGGASVVAPSAAKQLLAVAGNRSWRTSVTGSTPEYLPARGFTLAQGRELTGAEVSSGRAVCLLGATPAKELFGASDPLGSMVRLGRMSCQVVGVLTARGAGMMGQDMDDLILLPLRTFQRRVAGNQNVSTISVTVAPGRSTSSVRQQIESLMRERRRLGKGDADDFNVRDMQEIISTVSTTNRLMTALLGAVAAVSLLVGGIGIMNIMLVSVTERTREIGVRLAVGALSRDVLWQFLIEAMTLSTLGGVVGVVVGLLAALGLTRSMDAPFLVSPEMIALAFVFSAFVGVLFGWLPARKAAQLNPIDALRHE